MRLTSNLRGLHRKHSHCTARGCIISSGAAPIAPQVGTEHLSSTAHSACAERVIVSQSTAQSRQRHRSALSGRAGLDWCVAAAACRSALDEFDPHRAARGRHDRFRPLSLHCSAHNGVASWPMAVTECRALLHCTEVHAMRLWPLIERDWLRVRSRCRCCDTGACFDCGAMSGATARVQQPDAMPPGVAVDAGGVCAHYRGTEGRALAISTCYTGSAGSLSSLSQHGRHQPE